MDHVWAAQQLKEFQKTIDDFHRLSEYLAIDLLEEDQVASYDGLIQEHGSYENLQDRMISLNPIMRDLINAAQRGLGDYIEPPEEGWSYEGNYW